MTGSNRRPSACKADALPAELILRSTGRTSACVATGCCDLSMPSLPLKVQVHIATERCAFSILSFKKPRCKPFCFLTCCPKKNGDPYGIRTRVTAVKGRCLNHLTNGPDVFKVAESKGFEPLRRRWPPTRFPIVLLRPLGQLSNKWLRRQDSNLRPIG